MIKSKMENGIGENRLHGTTPQLMWELYNVITSLKESNKQTDIILSTFLDTISQYKGLIENNRNKKDEELKEIIKKDMNNLAQLLLMAHYVENDIDIEDLTKAEIERDLNEVKLEMLGK